MREIEMDVPITGHIGRQKGSVRTGIEAIPVNGSSIFSKQELKYARAVISMEKIRTGKNYVTRTQPDGSLRVWRVA